MAMEMRPGVIGAAEAVGMLTVMSRTMGAGRPKVRIGLRRRTFAGM